ncbi:hypothetical protein [Saccharopolyspora elongata]|uniref:Uncharacterized protein n=1 Tax=Saccharopolyspora elongata TaxID=2530387 RepID=A0A4R4XUZ9_9PSEU|nr:hypothetical protein [Saccharopolyspora elongata]TDD35488.1 hypothetical protein E1288_43080 [Saccharopolyspora elongata]
MTTAEAGSGLVAAEELATALLTLQELQRDHQALSKDHVRLRDRHQQMLVQQRKDADRVYAAADRRAFDHLAARAGVVTQHLTRVTLVPFTKLVHQIDQLGERAGTRQVAELKQSAIYAAHLLDSHRTETPETAAAIDSLIAEVTRMREYIVSAGQQLHRDLAPNELSAGTVGCECLGCLLIVGMTLHPEIYGETPKPR